MRKQSEQNKARTAILFARVSTKDQEEFGHSLPAQIEKLRSYTLIVSVEQFAIFAYLDVFIWPLKYSNILFTIKRCRSFTDF